MQPLSYLYTHTTTENGTGYFSCLPSKNYSFETLCERLEKTPFDTFLHNAILSYLLSKSEHDFLVFFDKLFGKDGEFNLPLASCFLEAAFLRPNAQYSATVLQKLECFKDTIESKTPLLILALVAYSNANQAYVNAAIKNNRTFLTPFDAEFVDHAKKCIEVEDSRASVHITDAADTECDKNPISSEDLYTKAMEALTRAHIAVDREMRHEGSLSPIALLRTWSMHCEYESMRNCFTVDGTVTSYGRGLSLAQARLSCCMEVIERASAYVSCQGNLVLDRLHPMPILYERASSLAKKDIPFLDLSSLDTEIPPRDTTYAWVCGYDSKGQTIYVPAQCVFLFANFDEPDIYRSFGSTGIASGETLAQAKVAALLEILERDANATMPYTEDSFQLATNMHPLCDLLDDYEAHGIHVQFQEITNEFAIPAYRAYVVSPEGRVVCGQACKLSAKQALLAALTETPWHYPYSNPYELSPTRPLASHVPVRFFESLPDRNFPSWVKQLFFIAVFVFLEKRALCIL